MCFTAPHHPKTNVPMLKLLNMLHCSGILQPGIAEESSLYPARANERRVLGCNM